jgi:hypothetical protein
MLFANCAFIICASTICALTHAVSEGTKQGRNSKTTTERKSLIHPPARMIWRFAARLAAPLIEKGKMRNENSNTNKAKSKLRRFHEKLSKRARSETTGGWTAGGETTGCEAARGGTAGGRDHWRRETNSRKRGQSAEKSKPIASCRRNGSKMSLPGKSSRKLPWKLPWIIA